MPDEQEVSYPLRYRAVSVISMTLGMVFGAASLGLANAAYEMLTSSAEDRMLLTLPLVFFFVLLGMSASLLFLATRSTWVYHYRYTMTDLGIGVRKPFARASDFIAFEDAVRIHCFPLYVWLSPSPTGRIIESKLGSKIKLTDDLPIWPLISERCHHVQFDERPTPWWEYRR